LTDYSSLSSEERDTDSSITATISNCQN